MAVFNAGQRVMFQLLYASGASRPMSTGDLDDILAASRRNNAGIGVTGLLLYAENTFLQVLEGEEKHVRALVERIKLDPRHRNFMTLYEMPAENRAFAQWEMGFRLLEPGRAADASVFRATRDALDRRIGRDDGGLMFEMVLAFGRDMVAA